MQYWLVKQEPESYSFDDLVEDGQTAWTGIRNFAARNHLRAMEKGDLVLYYHSVTGKEIVGVARVATAPYEDRTANEGDWSCVDLKPVQKLRHPVSLETIKKDKLLSGLPLLRQSRLSVMPVKKEEFDHLMELGKGPKQG